MAHTRRIDLHRGVDFVVLGVGCSSLTVSKGEDMPLKTEVGSRIQIWNKFGEYKFVKSGGGLSEGHFYKDPTLGVVESLPDPPKEGPKEETHEITQDEMPSQGDPQEPQAA